MGLATLTVPVSSFKVVQVVQGSYGITRQSQHEQEAEPA